MEWWALKQRRYRILLVIALLVLAVPAVATLQSAIGTRVFADVARHETFGPTGWSGLGFPVDRGDVVIFDFGTRNATGEVSVRFGESLGHRQNSVYPYNVTTTEGHFRFVVPSKGVIEFNYRPIRSGESFTTYRIRVIPNPTGLSVLPLFE